ncbi:hypothetical protein N657DRAFT_630045 [Parathielavia appendiculata]|uniref:Uncharacterized protein n=1 Tax=Parathielavia appendiculata TaxID=2587402 RepID=A0AAN6UCI9_9PEZI|nr:hypothetical protein N657DRAFT_630045 [Parathielavia appendiculata]
MGRLPPAEKLSLAVRKNVRDEWENKKADLEEQLSGVLGTAWTIDIQPNAIWPYHNDGYAKESLGSCIKAVPQQLMLPSYVEGAIYQINYIVNRYGDDFKKEVNTICGAHILSMDLEEAQPPRFSYGGCDVLDGKLRILFVESNLGTNIDYCCQEEALTRALNEAPGDTPMSFKVRMGIRTDYDPKIHDVRRQIAGMLGKPEDAVTLTPNFEATFAKLDAAVKAGNSDVRDDWQRNLADFTFRYFDALAYQMKYIKVGEDELVQEGVLEAVSTNEYAFRIVDELKHDSYCEVDIEDGVLYLQTTPGKFGINIDYVASKLMDRL